MAGFSIPTRMTQELLAPIAAAGLERSPQIGCVRQGA